MMTNLERFLKAAERESKDFDTPEAVLLFRYAYWPKFVQVVKETTQVLDAYANNRIVGGDVGLIAKTQLLKFEKQFSEFGEGK